MANKKHRPTAKKRREVQSMAAVGTTQKDIAIVMGIDAKTLRKHYRKELDEAMTKANASVAGKLYSAAMSGDVRAQIFWCKTRLCWRETNRTELTGADGDDIASKIKVEFVGVDKPE